MDNHLFSGEWRISRTIGQTAITTKPSDKSRYFRISCSEISDNQFFTVRMYIDNKPYISTMSKGSSYIIQGKSVYLEQVDATHASISGQWEIIQEPHAEYEESVWTVHPDTGNHNILAFFEEETEFVIFFRKTPECNNGKMTITIDGRVVKDFKGEVLSFLSGSSIMGKGKNISVSITGECSPGQGFRGELKIRKIQ